MEVILREHVETSARRGEIVKVADGYARNYLLPRKLALLATDGNKKQIERERAKFERKEAEEQKVAEALAERLANVEVVIARRVGETDALYGSVTTADIAEALRGEGLRDRSPQAAAGRADQDSSASSTCRSSCTATSTRTSRSRSSPKARAERTRSVDGLRSSDGSNGSADFLFGRLLLV